MPNSTILAIGRKNFGAQIQDLLSPLGVRVVQDVHKNQVEVISKRRDYDVIIFDDDYFRREKKALRKKIIGAIGRKGKPYIMLSSRKSLAAVREAYELGAAEYIIKPFNYREFFSRCRAILEKKIRITCIGGGTGLFHILLALKKLPRTLLTSIVSMSDDGGSSGKLRASFGILPPGDIRRSLVALSNAPQIMNELMQFRFKRGGHFSGHNLGNLFLTALSEIKGSIPEAVRAISDILNVQGIVFPVTDTLTTLCARFENDTVIKGESRIDLSEERDPTLRISKIWHEPATKCTVDAFAALVFADYITIGPGDLYTSILTNMLAQNIPEALGLTKAKIIYICNLMTKPGETAGYSACDHVREVQKHLKGAALDYVLVSNTELSYKAISEYSQEGQHPVSIGGISEIQEFTNAEIILADVGHETELVRHDSSKMRREILKILRKRRRVRKKA